MTMNDSTPKKMVIRSRFRSTTDDEPSVEDTPPPNRSDKPPPLPLCRRTSRTITRLTMIRMTESAISTAVYLLAKMTVTTCCQRLRLTGRRSLAAGQLAVPADRSELGGIEASAADEGSVYVLLPHNRRDVVVLH